MLSSRKVVKFFYDVSSPYSWLAFEVLFRYRNVWNIDLKLKPAYLAGIIRGSGNQPPEFIHNKLLYMVSDLRLLSKYFEVPMCEPKTFPDKDTVNAMRFVTAVAEKYNKENMLVERVSRELWKRIWTTHQDVTQPASLTEAGLKAGLSINEVEEILTLAKSDAIKEKMRSVTREALGYKCFGLPFIVCHVNGKDQVFFGSDRFELMAHFLGEKWMGPQPANLTATM